MHPIIRPIKLEPSRCGNGFLGAYDKRCVDSSQHVYHWESFANNFTGIAGKGFENCSRLLPHMYGKQ